MVTPHAAQRKDPPWWRRVSRRIPPPSTRPGTPAPGSSVSTASAATATPQVNVRNSGQETPDQISSSLDYSRRLYSNVVGWYKTAETKAQILLTLDGVVVSLLIGALFRERDAAKSIVDEFGWETWVAVGTAAAALGSSIVAALMCLVSRVMSRREIKRRYPGLLANPLTGSNPPEIMWFFQTISRLDEARYQDEALKMTRDVESRAVANQNYLLSGKVLKKLLWVNWGFAFAALGFLSLVGAGTSYLIRLAG